MLQFKISPLLTFDDQKSKRLLIIDDVETMEDFEEDIDSDNSEEEPIDPVYKDEEISDEENGGDNEENFKFNRSGLKRSLDDVDLNGEIMPRIAIRHGKYIANNVTETIVLGCVDASVTINQSLKLFQSFCKNHLKEKVYLNISEVPQSEFNVDTEAESPSKKLKYSESLITHEKVLPSYRTVGRKMHTLAIVKECNTALQLLEKGPDEKATLHYDSTSRKRLQGEQTSLILHLSSGHTLKLRPLTIAKETQESITEFIIMEVKRIAIAADVDDPTKIWNLIDAIMTDAAAKNLGVESMVSLSIGKDMLFN
jgi:hypothetical protein